MAIALLTDFGTADHYVGAVRGAILTVNPTAAIIDITHEIPKHDIHTAAFVLAACFRDFPAGTVFVAVVDPGVGSERRAIVVEAHGSVFVAPDNGVLSRVLGLAGDYSAYQIVDDRYFGSRRSTTFHGRDIFAPVAAHISCGVWPSQVGPAIKDLSIFEIPLPRSDYGRSISAEIIHVDRFGNLITNLLPSDLPANFSIKISGRRITRLETTYSVAAPGEPYLIEGSAGYLEISISAASAADRLGIASGCPILVEARGRPDILDEDH